MPRDCGYEASHPPGDRMAIFHRYHLDPWLYTRRVFKLGKRNQGEGGGGGVRRQGGSLRAPNVTRERVGGGFRGCGEEEEGITSLAGGRIEGRETRKSEALFSVRVSEGRVPPLAACHGCLDGQYCRRCVRGNLRTSQL